MQVVVEEEPLRRFVERKAVLTAERSVTEPGRKRRLVCEERVERERGERRKKRRRVAESRKNVKQLAIPCSTAKHNTDVTTVSLPES